jgi:hypothetical protein
MKRPLIFVLILLLLATMACTININIPKMETITPVTVNISEAAPAGAGAAQLKLNMGAGTFNLTGGAEKLVEGTIRYNIKGWDPQVTRNGSQITITQGEQTNITGIPTETLINEWNLKLNDITPLELQINAGAYKGDLDFSGLHLRHLEITDGASQTKVYFNVLNPEKMDLLSYKTGASQVELTGLSNANFTSMTFNGGAGSYTLDFSGKLLQPATVTVKTGVSNLTLIFPAGTSAKVTNTGAVSNLNTQGTWTVNGDTYTISGDSPLLTVQLETGVGNVRLISK